MVDRHDKNKNIYTAGHDDLLYGAYSDHCVYKSVCYCEAYKTAFKCLIRLGMCKDMIRLIISMLREDEKKIPYGHIFKHHYNLPINYSMTPVRLKLERSIDLDIKCDGDYILQLMYKKSKQTHVKK
jgi:hypothetical protein